MSKSQSAMEYLMTYGWAILAVAVVMVSLYSLGIFNAGNLQSTANPGSCQVIRTAAQTSLAGQCINLMPKYVGQFNGQNSYIALPSKLGQTGPFTIAMWIKPSTTQGYVGLFGGIWNGGANDGVSTMIYGGLRTFISNSITTDYLATSFMPPTNSWSFVAIVWTGTPNSTALIQYFNSSFTAGQCCISPPITGPLSWSATTFNIGLVPDVFPNYYFPGSMANFQIYNTSLDSNSIRALYHEGVGGTPIDINHLVGWYPLNGNANDYSGNNNHGVPTNVIWSANWQSGYTAPTS